jgi:hypothetical protein
VPEDPHFIVFPIDPESGENPSLSDLFPGIDDSTGAAHSHTRISMATHTAAVTLYEFVEPSRGLPTCLCGCGARIRGKQKYATTACQVRAWRASHNGGQRPEVRHVLTACYVCQGWKLGNGEPFQCESCADPDAPYHYSDLLRLSPRPNDPVRSVMIYIGTSNVPSYRQPGGEWTQIVGQGDPLIDRLIEALGGCGNRVTTARLVAEAEKQVTARQGHQERLRIAPTEAHSEADAEMHAAVLRDREAWAQHPLTDAVRLRQSKESREHTVQAKIKYAALAHERPDLFE